MKRNKKKQPQVRNIPVANPETAMIICSVSLKKNSGSRGSEGPLESSPVWLDAFITFTKQHYIIYSDVHIMGFLLVYSSLPFPFFAARETYPAERALFDFLQAFAAGEMPAANYAVGLQIRVAVADAAF